MTRRLISIAAGPFSHWHIASHCSGYICNSTGAVLPAARLIRGCAYIELKSMRGCLLPMALPEVRDAERYALFFDFDGTLADIAARPDEVRVSEHTRTTLQALSEALGGAVAIISGREIASVDGFLGPVQLAISGVHGLTRRDALGRVHASEIDSKGIADVEQRLVTFVAANPGLLLETKRGAVALHYRQRPELEAASHAAMRGAVNGKDSIKLRPGKMVIEALAHEGNKGAAIGSFLAEPPFRGRLPVFAGDDVTDEDGFALVNSLSGISIKVGAGETQARYRAKNTQELLSWLKNVLEDIEADQ
jgi:trehalose 6-phosphate phosphatase